MSKHQKEEFTGSLLRKTESWRKLRAELVQQPDVFPSTQESPAFRNPGWVKRYLSYLFYSIVHVFSLITNISISVLIS